jgi:hypothetical protein
MVEELGWLNDIVRSIPPVGWFGRVRGASDSP